MHLKALIHRNIKMKVGRVEGNWHGGDFLLLAKFKARQLPISPCPILLARSDNVLLPRTAQTDSMHPN